MADVEFSHNVGAYGRDSQSYDDAGDRNNSLTMMTNLAGAAVSLALIAGIGVWGYKLMVRDVSGIPVVRAAEGDMRVRPVDPGGQLALHQGLAVNTIAAEGVASGPVDRVVLAPRSIGLSQEDQPIQTAAVAPVQQPEPLAPAGVLFEPITAEDDILDETLAERAQAGAIDALVAELTSDIEPLAEPSGDETPVVGEDVVDETVEIEPIEVAGVTSSKRPRLRPATNPAFVQTAAFVVEEPVESLEIDAAAIPAGTRLVQLGAFDSADVARSEWARMQGKFGDYMSDKSRVVQKAQSGGRTFYRLRAMGFVDLGDARRFCSAFKAEGVDCIPVASK